MPQDVIQLICSHLDGSDIRGLYSVSRSLRGTVGGLLTGKVVIDLQEPGKYNLCM